MMKKINQLLIILLAAFSAGCTKDGSDLLDKAQVNDIYEDMVFSDPQYAVWYLNSIYKEMNADYWRFGTAGFLGNATDEGHCKANWDNAYVMGTGSWGPTKIPIAVDVWKKNYAAIRAANRFIDKVDLIPDADNPLINAQIRQRMKGEAIFLRAFFYADLLKYFGGVPIVTTVLEPDDEEILFEPRETYDATVDFISTELEKALPLLPNADEVSASEFGRITKGAALALSCKVRLFAASLLFNDPINPANSEFRGKYSANKWLVAAEAAKRFITGTNSLYALHKSTAPDKYGDYEDFFIRRYSPEVILSYQNKPSGNDNLNLERICFPGQFFNYTNGNINNLPLLNLVADYEVVKVDAAGNVTDSYELGIDKVLSLYASGTTDPVSGWDPQNPYVNRDPRFYQSVFFNQSLWPARAGIIYNIWQKDPASALTADGAQYLTGFYNTGFFDRKFLNAYANQTAWGTVLNVNHNYPIIRYAEILLNYAEAVNEAFSSPDVAPGGYPMSARDAVNQIRARAIFPAYTATIPPGMPIKAKGKSMPPIPTGLTQEQMRAKIRHERRIEFAYEEQRFWDIRRWKIGKQTENIYGQTIFKRDNGTFRYATSLIEVRLWDDKYNLFPMWESELMKNPKLVQNPGWGKF
jgi:starch-binding outer membrane protein, SusD/RagB family